MRGPPAAGRQVHLGGGVLARSEAQLVGALLHRRDHEGQVLVEVHAELLGAAADARRGSLPTAKLGCFSFFLTDFGVIPTMPVGRTSAHAATNPDSSSTA